MSRPSTDELTRAIELANLEDVKRLMAEGANPYESNSNGQSALEVWQDSQKKGNPYAGQMGLALLERAPASLAEASHLYQLRAGKPLPSGGGWKRGLLLMVVFR